MANARKISLTDALARIRYRADIEGQTTRHPDASLAPLLSQAWQDLRTSLAPIAPSLWRVTKTGTLSTTESTDGHWVELEIPDDATNYPGGIVEVLGVDIKIQDNWYELDRIEAHQANDFEPKNWVSGYVDPTPQAWFLLHIGKESTTTVGATKVGITPVPATAYTYALHLEPAWVDIASGNGTYVFHDLPGFMDYAVYDVMIQIADRDHDTEERIIRRWETRRNEALMRAMQSAARVGGGGGMPRVDTRGRRRQRVAARYWQ